MVYWLHGILVKQREEGWDGDISELYIADNPRQWKKDVEKDEPWPISVTGSSAATSDCIAWEYIKVFATQQQQQTRRRLSLHTNNKNGQ